MVRWTLATWIGSALLACAAASLSSRAVEAQQSAPPPFVDERRLPPTETEIKAKAEADRLKAEAQETKDKAEAERRAAAEAEARQKAEEQRRQATEAEARQKAEEQRRQAAETEARQKAEEQRRQATEAEARQKADDQRRQAAETEARQKAEEQRRQAAEAEAKQKAAAQKSVAPPAPVPASRAGAAADCSQDRIAARAISGGRVEMTIESPCRQGQPVVVRYGAFELKRQLDAAGRGAVILDLFQGKSPPVSLQIGASAAQPVSLDAVDLTGLSKAAVVWQAPVNLDLHVYEYAARHGDPGHIWPGAPSSADAAETETRATKRGRGFLSTTDDGRAEGDKVEVYTFWHHPEQRSGLVATALDYETRGGAPRGETCGDGVHATVVYETFVLNSRGELSRERGAIAPATCGSQLAGAGRYMEDAVPDLSAAP